MDLATDDKVLNDLAPPFLRSHLVALLALPGAGAPASRLSDPQHAKPHSSLSEPTPSAGMLSPDLHIAAFFWSFRSQFKCHIPREGLS